TSHPGWGCIRRTGESLLATALIHQHIGQDWQRPPCIAQIYTTYFQILTSFFDSPCPFSCAGWKGTLKDVERWFGPNTAAGTIQCVFIPTIIWTFYPVQHSGTSDVPRRTRVHHAGL
ncbi:hypothetical protein EI94DRAFT_1572650, partial [Lactarius quietus]